ncbi:MAG: Ig-like domain-containing protein [Bacteroidales bacterium]|nr:Ig-like domain-containing protein [Bacteroidales bacterium]
MKQDNLLQKEKLAKRLTTYSATAAAMIALTPDADAQVVYSGLMDSVMKTGVYKFDLNNDSQLDIPIKIDNYGNQSGSGSGSNIIPLGFIRLERDYSASSFTNLNVICKNYQLIHAQSTNYGIDKSNTNWKQPYHQAILKYYASPEGEFHGQGEKYIGIRFKAGTDTLYGWLRVELPKDLQYFKLIDWAYESTPNKGITTGHQRPNVNITSTQSKVSGPFDITITFDTKVKDFIADGITVFNGDVKTGEFHTTDSITYTATIEPKSTGDVEISIAENKAKQAIIDLPSNASNVLTVYADIEKPGINITADNKVNGEFSTTFTFTEDVTGFIADDIELSPNAKIKEGSFTKVNDALYTAVIDPQSSGQISVRIPENMAHDELGNGNNASSTKIISADIEAPICTMTTEQNVVSDTFKVLITFSEDVSALNENDLVITNGIIYGASFTKVSDSKYSLIIEPNDTDNEVTLRLPVNTVHDNHDNYNATTILKVRTDYTAPKLTITPEKTLVNGDFEVDFDFNEAVTGFTKDSIEVVNATVNSLVSKDNNTTFTASLSPVASGNITINIPVKAAFDSAGNANIAAENTSVVADLDAPKVEITTSNDNLPVNDNFKATFTFNEKVLGFAEDSIKVVKGEVVAGSFETISEKVYTVTIKPTEEGDVKVVLPANSLTDMAGNANQATESSAVKADFTTPTASITSNASATVNGIFEVTVTFSEKVFGFKPIENTDIMQIANGSVQSYSDVNNDGKVFNIKINPSSSGQVSVSVPANVVTDVAGNHNTASAETINVNADIVGPTLTIGSNANRVNAVFDINITTSEAVTGFTEDDIVVTNGSIVAGSLKKVSDVLYTATVQPTTSGIVTVTIGEQKMKDVNGTYNPLPSNILKVDYDPTSLNEVTLKEQISMFPNPANNEITISFSDYEGMLSVQVFDISGKQVLSNEMENNTQLDVANLSEGLYIARITTGKSIIQKQLIIKR